MACYERASRVPKDRARCARTHRPSVLEPEVALTNSRAWLTSRHHFDQKVISVPNDRRVISFPGGGFGIRPRMSTFNRILVVFGLSVVCYDRVGPMRAARPPPTSPSPELRLQPCSRTVPRETILAAHERPAHPGHHLRERDGVSRSNSESAPCTFPRSESKVLSTRSTRLI